MGLGAPEQALPYERFTKEQLYVFLGPLSRRQCLEEHHRLLKVHLKQLICPLDKKSCADIEMKVRESLVLGLGMLSADWA